MAEERKWFNIDNIIDNKKRRKKIDAVNGLDKMPVIRRFVVAEAAAQKIHLTDEEIYGFTYKVFRHLNSLYV